MRTRYVALLLFVCIPMLSVRSEPAQAYEICHGGYWAWTGGWGLLGPSWGYRPDPDFVYIPRRCYVVTPVSDCDRRYRLHDYGHVARERRCR